MPLLMVMEVFVLDPSSRLVVVPFPGPLPEHLKDGTIYILKDFLAHHMLVIPCPPANERVEQQDQISRCGSLVLLHDLSDFFQERFHVLLGRFDNELPIVLAYMLSEEVEAIFNMRHEGFLSREGQSSFPHELLHEGFDFVL